MRLKQQTEHRLMHLMQTMSNYVDKFCVSTVSNGPQGQLAVGLTFYDVS